MADILHISRFLLDGVGLWSEVRRPPLRSPGRVLLLDRDGVLNDDRGYVGKASDLVMLPNVCAAIASCNRAGIPVAIVTNQSGIGRGYYDWDGFAEVQGAIDIALEREGGAVDAVFACAYLDSARDPFAVANHPWRKPGAGMLNLALNVLNGSREHSGMIGDKVSDMAAAHAAQIGFKCLIAAHPVSGIEQLKDVIYRQNPGEAIAEFANLVNCTVALHQRSKIAPLVSNSARREADR